MKKPSFWQNLFSRLGLGLLWLLHGLPLPLLRFLGRGLGGLLFLLGRQRRKVARINLRLCFPEWSTAEQEQVLRRHFVVFAQSLLDRTLFWWASRARLQSLIHLTGKAYLERGDGCPTLVLAPHFVGLDAGGVVLTLDMPMVSVYSHQKNPVFDAVFLAGRKRFSASLLLSRQEGMRRAVKAMKEGMPFYYLPDMDFGYRASIFVPFFGIPAATISGVSRLARATGAKVVPCISRMTAEGYDVCLMPPLEDFPGASVEEDTARINRFIETQIRAMPEQYYWLHKRFKTRPKGAARIY